jgi:hypothetical protein
VVDDVLTVAAIMEQGGIVVPTPSRNKPDRPDWRRMVPDEQASDALGQLAVWELAGGMNREEMRQKGVSQRSYYRAKEIRQHLAQAVRRMFKFGSTGDREAILKSISAGMVDHLYHRESRYGEYRNGDEVERQLGQSSLVSGTDWLVGEPFDLEIETRRGKMTLHLVEMASRVNPMWLAEIAPQLVEFKTDLNPRYNPEKDVVVSTTETYFNGAKIGEETVDNPEHGDAGEVFARWLSGRSELTGTVLDEVLKANSARQSQARELNTRIGEETFKVYSLDEVYEFYRNALMGARRVQEIESAEALRLPALDNDLVGSVLELNPNTVMVLGKEFPVRYSSSDGPSVKIDFINEGLEWRELPDAGIFLPSGREIGIQTDGYTISSLVNDSQWQIGLAPSSGFKTKVCETLNKEQWEKRKVVEVALITVDSDESDIPFVEITYGEDALTGEELVGYGTNIVSNRYWSSSPYFEVFWTRDKDEAESIYDKAKSKLAELKVTE